MRALALVFAASVAVLHAPGVARADGYIGAGLGSDSDLGGALETHFRTGDDAGAGRLFIGQRMGLVGLEASLFGTDLNGASGTTGDLSYSTLSLGVDLKIFVPLFGPLEGFVKAGLNKTWLQAPDARKAWDYDGRGRELGGGLQLNLDLPLTSVGVWLDYTHQTTDLRDGGRQAFDGSVDMLTLGVALGL